MMRRVVVITFRLNRRQRSKLASNRYAHKYPSAYPFNIKALRDSPSSPLITPTLQIDKANELFLQA